MRAARSWTRRCAVATGDSGNGSAIASSSSSRASPMSRSRRLGSFSRQRRSSARTRGGVSAGSAVQSGSVLRIAATRRSRSRRRRTSAARQHLEQHAAERPDVGALVDRLAARLLRDSCRRRCRGSRPRRSRATSASATSTVQPDRRASADSSVFARPKSSTFTVPSARDLDVRGLEIAVDDALLVRRLERLGDLPRDRRAPRRAASPSLEPASSIRSASVSPSTSSSTSARACRRVSSRP